ncbi:MAG: hypothetical protein RL477_1955, partial [Pseudomonadota bacterium]
GRVLTEAAWMHLGLKAPAAALGAASKDGGSAALKDSGSAAARQLPLMGEDNGEAP